VSALAIIPARGGTKTVPRKNVLPLCGRPLIYWTICAARAAERVDRVIVSTDDEEIAKISQQYEAEVVWRPPEISGDTASSESALLHVLEHFRDTEQEVPAIVAFLQCTSPLTLPEDIDGTVEALLNNNADSAVAVTPFHYFLWRSEDGACVGINHDKRVRLLRQQRDDQYLETGAVYAVRSRAFLEAKQRFCGLTAMYVMPPDRCQEIDDPVDFEIAEVLLRHRLRRDQLSLLPKTIAAIVFDFDGVFTDSRVVVMQDGRESVICHRGDGAGLAHLERTGVSLLVISAERNPVVGKRCEKLNIPYHNGIENKLETLRHWLGENEIAASDVVYVGNDVNDLECLAAVGCGVVVSDAHPDVKKSATMVLSSPGGHGAIRELADLVEQKLLEDGHAAQS